jgi:hypothetical protein
MSCGGLATESDSAHNVFKQRSGRSEGTTLSVWWVIKWWGVLTNGETQNSIKMTVPVRSKQTILKEPRGGSTRAGIHTHFDVDQADRGEVLRMASTRQPSVA